MEDCKYLIPEESMDVIINNVNIFRKIENDFRNIFINHQYQEVLMPDFEYVDLYTKLDSGFVPEKIFQYINQEGKSVAMRCDFTIPLARTYASRKEQKEARYCYFGKVYRKESRHKGRQSESYQAGIELMNKPGLEGDQECLEMVQETIARVPLNNLIIELGSASFFHRLCTLVGDGKTELTKILTYRDISGMKAFVKKHHFDTHLNALLLALPTCFGDITMLQEIKNKVTDTVLKEALLYLEEVYQSISSTKHIIFDLGMVPSMKYYTGLMIKGYSDNSAYPILYGGRYDDLLPRFKVKASAIGFCYHMDRILQAIEKEGEYND